MANLKLLWRHERECIVGLGVFLAVKLCVVEAVLICYH